MRTIITGITGQLGQALKHVFVERDFDVLDTPRWDVRDHTIVQAISDCYPDLVIHAAAMTNVDGCAKDPDEAFKVNAFGTQNVAHACMRCNAQLVYISTNEVFNGQATEPYTEDAEPQPINPYGSSKRAGEQMAARYLRTGLYVVRTAWVFGGGHMFPEKIVAAADKHGQLRVVTDEVSNPTYIFDLATAIADLVETQAFGLYHLTNEGYCSRFEYAQEVLRLSGRGHIPVEPITLADYSRPSAVPPFSALANTKGTALGLKLRSWQEAIAEHIRSKNFS
ncbi:MAG TPA: dTDP-4-dehydrorhamnose reductase [Anaerolineae bacterium]|nr:dTDP-4-dehydrorhamnose reductase [Anaerolineae bacterium]HMR64461.1 dTDP-4-dehydrorhamnose reductase [Anaerolineae bacterium]